MTARFSIQISIVPVLALFAVTGLAQDETPVRAPETPRRIASYDELVASLAKGGATIQTDNSRKRIRIATTIAESESWMEVYWKADKGVVQFIQPLGFRIPESRLAATESAVARLNHAMDLPGFAINHQLSIVYCRHVLLLRPEDGGVPERVLQNAFRTCRQNAERFGASLKLVADNKLNPDRLIAHILQNREPSSNEDSSALAKAMLAKFVQPDANHVELSRTLRPQPKDYKSVFTPEFAATARKLYEPVWEAGEIVVKPKKGQTEVVIVQATGRELRKGEGDAHMFPGGYRQVAPHIQSDVVVHLFRFVRPGEKTGMRYDGLVRIGERWVLFPKPWLALPGDK